MLSKYITIEKGTINEREKTREKSTKSIIY